MTSILPHLPDQIAFQPEDLRIISQAFDDACNALHVFAGDAKGRQIIATRIIDLASAGVTDAKALRDRILLEASVAA